MDWKIALIGLGAAARNIHLPAYRKIPRLKIVGAFDVRPIETIAPIPLFDDLDRMLSVAKPDICAIITPPDTHYSLAMKALLADCHVFCEKPFATTLSEADQIISLAKERKKQVIVNSEFRFMKIHSEAKARINSASFGKLLFASLHQTFLVTQETEAGWRGEDPQRTLKEFGTHALDLARYYFDEDPLSIYARMPKPTSGVGPDFLNLVQLEFSDDRVAQITLDRLSRGRHRYLDSRLDGEHATIETSIGGRLQVCAGIRAKSRRPFLSSDIALGGRARLYRGEEFQVLARAPFDLFADATARLLHRALEAIESDRLAPCNAEDNRKTLALMLAGYRSAAERRPIVMQY